MSSSLIGKTINDHYLLTEVLGEGGMGIVFKAEDLNLNRRLCAVKLLKGQTTDPNEAKRFEAELQIISRLRSPHVVQVLNKGYFEGHRLYIVMELLEGESLSELIKRVGALKIKRAIQITKGILAGLSEAHEYGVVHRDLKPANIFITRSRAGDEITKVLDFGIAKDTNRDESSGLTSASVIIGTPKYMAPEQFMKSDTDQRTDLYAVGLLLYQMLSGVPPYVANSELVPDTLQTMPSEFQVGWLHLNAEPAPIDTFPPLWNLCRRLLEKTADARPANAADVIMELNEISERLSTTSNPYVSREFPAHHTPSLSTSGSFGSHQQFNTANSAPTGPSGPYQQIISPDQPPTGPSAPYPNTHLQYDDPSTTGIPLIAEFSSPAMKPKKSSQWMIWLGIASLLGAIGAGAYISSSQLGSSAKPQQCYHRISVEPAGVYTISKTKLKDINGVELKNSPTQGLGKTGTNGQLVTLAQISCGETWSITAQREGYTSAQLTVLESDSQQTYSQHLKSTALSITGAKEEPQEQSADTDQPPPKEVKAQEKKPLSWKARLRMKREAEEKAKKARSNKRSQPKTPSKRKAKRSKKVIPPKPKEISKPSPEPTIKPSKPAPDQKSEDSSAAPGLMF